MREFIEWVGAVPEPLVYLALGLGAAVENVVPAVPADTFVALGGFLSAFGDLDRRWIFVATWLLNVLSALAVYRIGYMHGPAFFERGWGRRVLRPHQMERMRAFYARYGVVAIFLTRFLPGLRSVVPVFAGVAHQPAIFVALPIATASAIWYGGLIWLGVFAGRNLSRLRELLGGLNGVLGAVAVVSALGVAVWWWRTRRHPHE